MRKCSDRLLSALRADGAERVGGAPGEERLDVVDFLRGSSIERILVRHERGAPFSCGRLTGKRGVCITHHVRTAGVSGFARRLKTSGLTAQMGNATAAGGEVRLVAAPIDYSENTRARMAVSSDRLPVSEPL